MNEKKRTTEILNLEFSIPVWEAFETNAKKNNVSISKYVSMWIQERVDGMLKDALNKRRKTNE